MVERERLQGLYALTDPQLLPDDTRLLSQVEAALRGGLTCLQYRDKQADASKALRQARALADLCRQYQCLFLVNDDIYLAYACQADGVHLGQSDGCLEQARDYLGPKVLLGRTCHASLQLAEAAAREGADYLAFGRCFPSSTKPSAPSTSLAIFSQATYLGLPLVGIGGINTPARAAEVQAAGAQMIACVEGVFAAPDPEQQVRKFNQALTQNRLTSSPIEVNHDSLSRTL